jgi:hypothetical protein
MLNSTNQLRTIAVTKTAEAYLRHRIGSNVLKLSAAVPIDSLTYDIWLLVQMQKNFVRESPRGDNVRLDGEFQIMPEYFHHTRRDRGILNSFESVFISQKAEAMLRNDIYRDLARMDKSCPKGVITGWSDMLDLDPDWSEKMIRSYYNHRTTGHYPGLCA